MTISPDQNQVEAPKTDTSEANLAKQRKYYEKQLEQERLARHQLEERIAIAEKERAKASPLNEDDEDDEPYVDKKKLTKTLAKFGEQSKAQTREEIQVAVNTALDQERRSQYLRENDDFNQVMKEETLEKFAMKHPKLAENIMRMPEGFERQKLVYENIKALGIDRPESKGPSIQDKIDANRKSPYYQPSGVGAAPYSGQSDFSESGQKSAYDKMKELQKRLRL
jgi:translation elongation factor P/translation initiation factor 5A